MFEEKKWQARHHKPYELVTVQNGYLIIDGTVADCQNPNELRFQLSNWVHSITSHLLFLNDTDGIKDELYSLSRFCAQLMDTSTSNPIELQGVTERDHNRDATYRGVGARIENVHQQAMRTDEQIKAIQPKINELRDTIESLTEERDNLRKKLKRKKKKKKAKQLENA